MELILISIFLCTFAISNHVQRMEAAIANIKRQMKELGLTQKELAQRSGLTVETVSRVLNERTPLTPNTLQKLSDGLSVSVSDLVEERSWSFNYAVQG